MSCSLLYEENERKDRTEGPIPVTVPASVRRPQRNYRRVPRNPFSEEASQVLFEEGTRLLAGGSTRMFYELANRHPLFFGGHTNLQMRSHFRELTERVAQTGSIWIRR